MSEIIIPLLLFALGIAIIVNSADAFIDASRWVSLVTGISKVVIGATVVSFATTSPEYFVSLMACLRGSNDLSIGNAVGSLICNVGIAMAILITSMHCDVDDALFGIKGFLMILSTFLLWVFTKNGSLSYPEGLVLFGIFLVFTFINIKYSKEDTQVVRQKTCTRDIIINIIKFVLGAFGIIFSSRLIVDNAITIAQFFNISERVIGLTVVAVGTSLPEIVTSIAAIVKKEGSISIGNILGANVIDATLILFTGTLVSKGALTVSSTVSQFDLPVAIIFMLVAVLPTLFIKRFSKTQGVALLLMYGAYLLNIAF